MTEVQKKKAKTLDQMDLKQRFIMVLKIFKVMIDQDKKRRKNFKEASLSIQKRKC